MKLILGEDMPATVLLDVVEPMAGTMAVDTVDDVGMTEEEMSMAEDEMGVLEDEIGIAEDEMGVLEDEMGMTEDEMGVLEDEMGIAEDEMGIAEDEMGIAEDEMGMMGTEIEVKDPLLSNWSFVGGISAATLVVGVVLGILLAKLKIKKGIDLYED